ncbi:MAG: fluoride efflux transporter CrcB [Pseudomonadota bacterium]|jgi:CrcB protein
MSWSGLAAVFIGAGLGAVLRWWLALLLNPVFPTLPLGTLAANALGGLLVGVLVALLSHFDQLAVEWRLFAITGMMGGLTTFSTFSVEVVTLIQRAQFACALLAASTHLFTSLALTAAGLGLTRWLLVLLQRA